MNSTEVPYTRKWLEEQLSALFNEQDREAVVNWVTAHRGRPKVVLIGSGFSRNAVLSRGAAGPLSDKVPLWPQVTRLLREGLGFFEPDQGPTDPLLIAEQYQESKGMEKFAELLLDALKDDEISPGPAHDALAEYNVEAIITTNQLDTLLDRKGQWFRVVHSTELPIARSRAGRTPSLPARQLIYLHGHRSSPATWIFSRGEYETVAETRPALVRRVQQLLSEYPLLILGYSLSDPDFHWIFSSIHREQEGFMPRALCLTVGTLSKDAERAHWRRMGMHLAHLGGRTCADSVTPLTPGAAITQFLALENQGPTPEDIESWLLGLSGENPEQVLRKRLDAFDRALVDIKAAQPQSAASSPGNWLFRCWRACLPTYPISEDAFRPRKSENSPSDGLRFEHLPEGLGDLARGESTSLLVGCNQFLVSGGTRESLGDWLQRGARWRIRPQPARTIGDTFGEAFARLCRAFLEDSAGGRHAAAAEGMMQEAHTAATAANWSEAAEKYGLAAVEFKRREDELGEWLARSSRCSSLMAISFRSDDRGPDWEAYQQEVTMVRRLDGTPDVLAWTKKRTRIMHSALEQRAKQAEYVESPTRERTEFSVAASELHDLIEEQSGAAVFPGWLPKKVELFLRLEGDDDLDTLHLILAYQVVKAIDLLALPRARSYEGQSERDRAFCSRLNSAVGRRNNPQLTGPQFVPTMAPLLAATADRFDSESAKSFLTWLVESWSRAPEMWFESAFSGTSVGVLASPFARLLEIQTSGTRVVEALQRVSTKPLLEKVTELDFWRAMKSVEWGLILTQPGVEPRKILEWHLGNQPAEQQDWTQECWRASLLGLYEDLAELSLDAEGDDGRIFEALGNPSESSAEWFQVRWVKGDRDELARSLPDMVAGWSLHGIESASDILLDRAIPLDSESALALKLSELGQAAIERETHSHVLARTRTDFALLALCLALGVGDSERQHARLRRVMVEVSKAPLWYLFGVYVNGRWAEDEDLASFVLGLPPDEMRDFQVLKFFAVLIERREDSTQKLPREALEQLFFLARRSVDSRHSSTASLAAKVLCKLFLRAAGADVVAGIAAPRVWESVERCSFHASWEVRKMVGYWLGRIELADPDTGLGTFPVAEVVETLLRDHSAAVGAWTRYGGRLRRSGI